VTIVSDVLRIKRTLDGAEIDKIIADVQARKALAIEHRRRARWRKQELAVNRFQAECGHASAAPLPYPAADRMR
jgi:hypothetical protein